MVRGHAGTPCEHGAGSKEVDWEVEPARRQDWIEGDHARHDCRVRMIEMPGTTTSRKRREKDWKS
jgi:hypothetical protein